MNAMPHIKRDTLMTLEAYSKARKEFRAKVIEHKKRRTVHLGEHVTLLFEDELTIRYQVQEMLRIERIFEEAGIDDELSAYNPLIPDGANLKATMLIEYEDVDERARMLAKLKGLEDKIWLRVADHAPVFAIADEDIERENDEKTSSVHFLRFELSALMIRTLKAGADIAIGSDHPHYAIKLDEINPVTRQALLADFSSGSTAT